jgi:hypothetical protein
MKALLYSTNSTKQICNGLQSKLWRFLASQVGFLISSRIEYIIEAYRMPIPVFSPKFSLPWTGLYRFTGILAVILRIGVLSTQEFFRCKICRTILNGITFLTSFPEFVRKIPSRAGHWC